MGGDWTARASLAALRDPEGSFSLCLRFDIICHPRHSGVDIRPKKHAERSMKPAVMSEANNEFNDVFISYPHEDHHTAWVLDIFCNEFEVRLRNELGRNPSIFVDKRGGIKAGDAWPERLKLELARSRTLVPIWSVDYFLHEWCRRECAVILHRERQLGYRTLDNPTGLILPISLFDGKKFPPFAKEIQWLDCTRFNRITQSYKTTPMYDSLLEELEKWVPEVARAIEAAPEFSAAWRSNEWLDDAIEHLIRSNEFDCSTVLLFKTPSIG